MNERIPDLTVNLDQPALMAYGAATWDWHRLHYDQAYARSRGFEGPVVDGQMFGALIARQIREWAGADTRFLQLSFRNRSFVTCPNLVRIVSTWEALGSSDQGPRRCVHSEVLDKDGRCVVDQGRTVIELRHG